MKATPTTTEFLKDVYVSAEQAAEVKKQCVRGDLIRIAQLTGYNIASISLMVNAHKRMRHGMSKRVYDAAMHIFEQRKGEQKLPI